MSLAAELPVPVVDPFSVFVDAVRDCAIFMLDPGGWLEGFAEVTGDETARRESRVRDRQLALLTERDRVSVGLGDQIVRGVYGAGLTLHAALGLSRDVEVGARTAGFNSIVE